jgi:hypothetical protein
MNYLNGSKFIISDKHGFTIKICGAYYIINSVSHNCKINNIQENHIICSMNEKIISNHTTPQELISLLNSNSINITTQSYKTKMRQNKNVTFN